MKYRILKKGRWYYPQYRAFLFWHNFYQWHVYDWGEFKTTVSSLDFQKAEQFILDKMEEDVSLSEKGERKVVAYY